MKACYVFILKIFPWCLWLKDVFPPRYAPSCEALGFSFSFSVGWGDNIAYGSRRQGWMICVGTLIICMCLQNALFLFVPPGCCACRFTFVSQSQTSRGAVKQGQRDTKSVSSLPSQHSYVPTHTRKSFALVKATEWTKQPLPQSRNALKWQTAMHSATVHTWERLSLRHTGRCNERPSWPLACSGRKLSDLGPPATLAPLTRVNFDIFIVSRPRESIIAQLTGESNMWPTVALRRGIVINTSISRWFLRGSFPPSQLQSHVGEL